MSTPYFPCAGARALHAPTRRDFLYSLGASVGSVAFSALLSAETRRLRRARSRPKSAISPPRPKTVSS